MTAETAQKPYATCQDCGEDFADRDAVHAHTSATMAPTGEAGVTARSHRVSIVNPTEAERRVGRVRMRIEDALNEAYDDLIDQVERGEFTAAEVAENLSMFDLRDGWDEYVAGADASGAYVGTVCAPDPGASS